MKSFIIITILLISSPAISAISFTNGKWETTFSCADWEQGNSLSCSQLEVGGGWVCGDELEWTIQKDKITSSANNPEGGGGKGFRHWKGDGYWNPTYNDDGGGGLTLTFPSAQEEFWMRWTMRYQSGFSWADIITDKMLYIHTDEPGYEAIPVHAGGGELVLGLQGPDDQYQMRAGAFGWNQIQGGTLYNGLARGDGKFHTYEIHIKMDTNGTDGIGRFWVDGVLRIENTHVNWSAGNTTARAGWTHMLIGSNQLEPNNGACAYVDFDDIVIHNLKPSNSDSFGNPYIGLISTAPQGLYIK